MNITRLIPKASIYDTFALIPNDDVPEGVAEHQNNLAKVFEDSDILRGLGTTSQSINIRDIPVGFTFSGRSIIQQQSMRGCTEAAVSMIARDLGVQPIMNDLQSSTLANTEAMLNSFRAKGLSPFTSKCDESRPLDSLRELIEKNGPAIVSIFDPQIMGHVLVVDRVNAIKQSVKLRDPYHGWAIEVTEQSFKKKWCKIDGFFPADFEIIQANFEDASQN